MNHRSRWLAIAAYAGIVLLVAGGLAWVTRAALNLEQSELHLKQSDTLRLALWRLDSRVFPMIAREDSRPIAHYDSLYPPLPALNRDGEAVKTGTVLVPSPLLSAELPAWMPLHFTVDSVSGWQSPQVIRAELADRLKAAPFAVAMNNADPARGEMLAQLRNQYSAKEFIGVGQQQQVDSVQLDEHYGRAPQQQQMTPAQVLQNEQNVRAIQQKSVRGENRKSEGDANTFYNFVPESGIFFAEKSGEWTGGKAMGMCVAVNWEPMQPRWLTGHDGVRRLMLLRPLQAKGITAVQGVLLDWDKLRKVLLDEISDLLPQARLEPAAAPGDSQLSMTSLPVCLVNEFPTTLGRALNSPMRVGLLLAWLAAAIAMLVVGLGGWSLWDLSERRFRFVTAVTHELRTPLTTLRLYTDMLTSGMVQSPVQRDVYLATLNAEAERLHRLIGNVLDFARLERQSPSLKRSTETIASLFESLARDWNGHCTSNGKQLATEIDANVPVNLTTDFSLVRQILGNLIDNACKYSREAADPIIRLRARREGCWLNVSVADAGPGVVQRECRSVFRPFTRGRKASESAGGVGLGLALAARWAKSLGGSLGLADTDQGACFQLRLPIDGVSAT